MRDDIACEVHDLLHFCCGESEHKGDARRDAAEEPNVSDRRCEVDMTHALAAHDGARDLHAALFADDTAEADTAVFTAVTFVVFFRTENALIKEAVFLRSLGAVVDRLRLGDLAE